MAQNLGIRPDMQAEQAFQAVARGCIERHRRPLPELRQSWDSARLREGEGDA